MRIGIDAGGTFTDFVILRDDGTLEIFKLRSNRSDPASVILAGIQRALKSEASGQAEAVHGSTVATNTLLERKGARTAFITSQGFRDLLAIGRQNRAELYSLLPSERVNLVPAELCFEWNGDTEKVWQSHPESIAICLLGAYRDGTAEQEIERALGSQAYVCRSSAIAPEFREYERASTTVVNAYVGPVMSRYLRRLEEACPIPVQIMQSSGGLLSLAEAQQQAVRTILSGPAGGVVAARAVAVRAGWKEAVAFDMGGTSTDVSVVSDPLRFATEAWVEGLPIRVPMLDIHTVGAGGGSLASVDAGGRLRVGPESAGADPGPACYGRGEQATVTDAHVVLGRILPERFLDGAMAIDPERARRAVETIGQKLSVDTCEAAKSILRIANSNMERAIRVVTVEQGRDPREFPLLAFGGCGGLHACELAEELEIPAVIFPPYAGALSALGMLLAAPARDYAAGTLGLAEPELAFRNLEEHAKTDYPEATIERYADIRYRGQSYELTVAWNGDNPRSAFEEAYRAIYGFNNPQRAIEIVTARVRARLPIDTSWFDADEGSRTAEEGSGPRLLSDYGSSVWIPDGWKFTTVSGGSLVAVRLSENLDALARSA